MKKKLKNCCPVPQGTLLVGGKEEKKEKHTEKEKSNAYVPDEILGAIKITKGFELLKDVCIDTHFDNRGRFMRLAQVNEGNTTWKQEYHLAGEYEVLTCAEEFFI